MRDDHSHLSPLRGLWSFVVGGVFLTVLIATLRPVTRPENCPNYGGTGDGSVFADAGWNVYLPLLALLWITATVIEQFLFTRRSRAGSVIRATAAIGISVVASCCGLGRLLTLCG